MAKTKSKSSVHGNSLFVNDFCFLQNFNLKNFLT
nr:MAG TPA: hypothetical protein [Caudoviricetes sp.]